MIRLSLPGVKGGDAKTVTVQVSVQKCTAKLVPVLTEVRPWFKDASPEDMGLQVLEKRSYIFPRICN